MYPSVVVCIDRQKYVAYPCRVDVVPVTNTIIPMIGFGDSADSALSNLEDVINSFIDLHGSLNANSILDSIYGKGNHLDISLDNHPMMKHFTEVI